MKRRSWCTELPHIGDDADGTNCCRNATKRLSTSASDSDEA
jgi:hypothetical protein